MAAGQVTTGFSKPYVAKYTASGSTITYASGQLLGRGVSVSFSAETSDDNNFYADNMIAETEAGVFVSGEITLTVDGLKAPAEKLIMGLPEAGNDGFVAYGDSQVIPFCGIGAIYRHQSAGVVTYRAIIYPKVTFSIPGIEAATQEDAIDWQTQELTATIHRADDANHNWQYVGPEQDTEALAEADIKTFFSIS